MAISRAPTSTAARYFEGEDAAPGTPDVRVNETLSRGLARRALDLLDEQGDRYRAGLAKVLRPRTSSKKAITRAKQEFIDLGERTRLIQAIGATENDRQVTVCQFVPKRVRDTDRRGAHVRFMLNQFVITRHGPMCGPDYGTAFVANDHALERLFLRLNTLDLGAVLEELHDAMLLALPLWVVGLALRVRQVALPTSSGAFICDLRPDQRHLLARTWLSRDRIEGSRWADVVGGLNAATRRAGGHSTLATVLCTGLSDWLDQEGSTVFEGLAETLASHEWLREPYARRFDPIGTAWKDYAAHSLASSM